LRDNKHRFVGTETVVARMRDVRNVGQNRKKKTSGQLMDIDQCVCVCVVFVPETEEKKGGGTREREKREGGSAAVSR
jgi:hypothetical protein